MASHSISVVIPVYNEIAMLPSLRASLEDTMNKLSVSYEVIFVDDGSTDGSPDFIRNWIAGGFPGQLIILSRNYGHQIAISAGLSEVQSDMGAVIMDADLQDPPELIEKFIDLHQQGFDVVHAARKKRKEGFFRRNLTWIYYRLMKSISNIELDLDSGDFCFISKRVVDILNDMPEQERYLRGLRKWVGFNQTEVKYERPKRIAGKTKYSFGKLLGLAKMGLFNFSEVPVRIISFLGFTSIAAGLLYLLVTIYRKYFYGDVPSGFTALIAVIVLFSGVQLISLGILGEYIMRVYKQVKNRPLFIIKEKYKKD